MSVKTLEFIADLRAAELLVPRGSTWLHKKGGIYSVTGHQIDTEGGVRVTYERIGGPEYDERLEASLEFSRPLSEWEPERFRPCEIKITAA